MGKGAATRDAIIDGALRLAVTTGLEGLSLGELAARLDLSKSGLFAHFRSKEALQLAVLEAAIALFRARVTQPALKTPRGRARLADLFERYLDWMKGEPDTGGCLFSIVSQEIEAVPASVRERLVEAQSAWRQMLVRAAGELGGAVEPEQLAFEFLSLALGYQQAMKVTKDSDARARAQVGFERLIPLPPG